MSYRLSGVLKKSSHSRSSTTRRIPCSVCVCYRSSDLFAIDYCCSTSPEHVKRQVCNSCLHQHVLSKLYSCLTSCVMCPEMNCSMNLSQLAICDILLRYHSHELLNDYLREQLWQGKNDEWIKRFAAWCPGCSVPIEKNGGCDEMICIRCQTHFYWSKAKRYLQGNNKQDQPSFYIIHPFIDGLLLVIILLFVILFTVIYIK